MKEAAVIVLPVGGQNVDRMIKTIIIIVLVLCIAIGSVVEYYVKKKSYTKIYYPISFLENMRKVNLPIVTFKNNNKTFHFLIDTGADNSIINSNDIEQFNYQLLENVSGSVYGMEGNALPAKLVRVNLTHDKLCFEEIFQVVEIKGFSSFEENTGIRLSGILGSNFLNRYDFVLNYKHLILHLSGKNINKTDKS